MAGLVFIAIALLSATASANTVFIGLPSLLTPNDTVMLLIDHQPFQFLDLHSHEPQFIQNNVIALAKTAKLFDIPVVLTTVLAERGGYFIRGVRDVFPDVEVIDRTYINAWEDENIVNAITKTGKKKLVIAALWTEVCLAMPVLSAMADDFEVYFVTDSSGGKSKESHDMAVQRMIHAGAVPLTTSTVLFELQRDWLRNTAVGVYEIMQAHLGATGIAFDWEVQLLNECDGGQTSTGVEEPTDSSSSTGGAP